MKISLASTSAPTSFVLFFADFIMETISIPKDAASAVRLSFISKSTISAQLNEIIHYVVVLYPNSNAKLMQDQELHVNTAPANAKPANLLIFIRRNYDWISLLLLSFFRRNKNLRIKGIGTVILTEYSTIQKSLQENARILSYSPVFSSGS